MTNEKLGIMAVKSYGSKFPVGFVRGFEPDEEIPKGFLEFGEWYDGAHYPSLFMYLVKKKPWYFEMRGSGFILHTNKKYVSQQV